jgi:hypothetical protein
MDSGGFGGVILLEDCRSDGSDDGPLSLRREMWKNGVKSSLR